MDLSLLNQISQVQVQIIRYEEPFILVLGNLGNLVNIVTFSRRDLRKNVCARYFICLCLAHLVLLDSHCLTRIITSRGINVFQTLPSLCKLRAYAVEWSILLSRYFLCLISIDRWMVTASSAWLRALSSARACRWLMIGGVTFLTFFSLHAPIGYQPTSIECTAPVGSPYALFVSIEGIIISAVPLLIMTVFSILTVINVRSRTKRQIQPSLTNTSMSVQTRTTTASSEQSSRQRFKQNIQLVRLSLLQVMLYFLLNSIWSLLPLYIFLTTSRGIVTINEQLTILFLGRLGLNLLYTYMMVRSFRAIFSKTRFTHESFICSSHSLCIP